MMTDSAKYQLVFILISIVSVTPGRSTRGVQSKTNSDSAGPTSIYSLTVMLYNKQRAAPYLQPP